MLQQTCVTKTKRPQCDPCLTFKHPLVWLVFNFLDRILATAVKNVIASARIVCHLFRKGWAAGLEEFREGLLIFYLPKKGRITIYLTQHCLQIVLFQLMPLESY